MFTGKWAHPKQIKQMDADEFFQSDLPVPAYGTGDLQRARMTPAEAVDYYKDVIAAV